MTRWRRYGGVIWRVAAVMAVFQAGIAFGMIPPSVTSFTLAKGDVLSPGHRTIIVKGHTLRGKMTASEVRVTDVKTGQEVPIAVPASNCERKVLASRRTCDGFASCEREIPPGGVQYDCRFEVRLERLPAGGHDVVIGYLGRTANFPTKSGP